MVKAMHNQWAAGQERRRLYSVWSSMHARCSDPKRPDFLRYGAQGVVVCDRWSAFSAFLDDMGSRPSRQHSLDRIDSTLPYEPGNCRWATASEQNRNRSNNHLITWRGETRCMTEWGELLGLSRDVLKYRLREGWSIERALSTPLQKSTGSAS